jgi:NAD(P)-dependent dehydrogenase (short-subunit alcohol dehydrogenase family)
MGASRGLGASLTKALVRQGCTVLANYQHSEEEARKLPREAIRVQGDAGDLDACRALDQRIAAQYGRLDFLVCNACPAPLPLRLEADTVDRINAYVGQGLALATVPMAVFLDRIAQSRGWAVLISSVYIEESPKEMPHYVAVKSALEGVARIAAKQYRQASFLVVRPPRMLTDMTKMPFGNENALHPHVVAARIAARVQGARVSDAPEILTWGVTD